MTTLELSSPSELNEEFRSRPIFYLDLMNKIQEYVQEKYEGFLINSVEKIEYGQETFNYYLKLERGNLMVDLSFDNLGELLMATFDY